MTLHVQGRLISMVRADRFALIREPTGHAAWPRLHRELQRIREPLVILILAALASALCGFCLHPQGFVLTLGLGAVIFVGITWPWMSVRGLRGDLEFGKSRVREGEPVPVRLGLRNRSPWGAWGLRVHLGLGARVEVGLSHVGGCQRAEFSWVISPDRRGVYPSGSPRVASGFPFGLWSASRRLTARNTLVVWPRTFAVGPIPQVASGRTSDGMAARNRPGGSGDFLGVRPYRRGDSLRRVHWPQTARSGQMVICELQTNAVPRIQIVLDLHPASHVGAGPDNSLEWAIRVAASFVVAWINAGAEVELVLEGRVVATPGGSGASRRASLLDTLARVADDSAMTLTDQLAQPGCRRFASGLRLVVATDRGVANLVARADSGCSERFVVLRAAAFDPTGWAAPAQPLPVTPWLWIDDAGRVPSQLRTLGKEVGL